MSTLSTTIQAAQVYLDPADVECVVYHSPCNDGSGAALSAWLKLGDRMDEEPFDIFLGAPEENSL